MLDQPRVRRGRPPKRFIRRLREPQRRGPLPDFRLVKPQIERERPVPLSEATWLEYIELRTKKAIKCENIDHKYSHI